MLRGTFDHIFNVKVDSWTILRHRVHQLFSQREIDTIQRSERIFDKRLRTTVFLSFESDFASLGGLAAVSRLLPVNLHRMNEKVIFISPFHSGCNAMNEARRSGVLVEVFSSEVFHLCNYEGVLTCYQDSNSEIPSYYLNIEGRFNAGENPYGYSNETELLLDSLTFSAAVPFTLSKLGIRENVLLHANDWETAPVAITSKFAIVSNLLSCARTILTLHNSFDSPISRELKLRFFGIDVPGFTVLQCTLPWLNGPLTTVSTPFAHELHHDPLQRGIFTDHLQNEFSMNPPVGIENGMFGENKCPYPALHIKKAQKGEVDALLQKKKYYRAQFLKQIESAGEGTVIGKITTYDMTDNTPVYFMSGRLDLMQKGFDIAFQAFERLERGSAKLFFCPSSSNGNLDFFENIAKRCAGDIVIWPFRMPQDAYELCIRGASYLVMPSLYEPFGAATEGYIQGTPVLARGTGGLWTQVNPWNKCTIPHFYGTLLDTVALSDKPTGILYHEDFPESEAEKLWRNLLATPVAERINNPLYQSIVKTTEDEFKVAGELFDQPDEYANVIVNGFEKLKSFSWERAVLKYKMVYQVASTRGV
jgi:glycogen synthase